MERFVVGTCETMCPPDEVKLRLREKLLHFYERKNGHQYAAVEWKVVKEFARSAAGMQSPKARDIRTPAALKRTIDYLLSHIVTDTRKPLNVAYDFIFDRLRCVRQEIVIQNLSDAITVELLEPICMFLAYGYYRLIEAPIDVFDEKICRQHLQECLKKSLVCYDNMDLQQARVSQTAATRRETIEAMYLLFNLGNAEGLTRFIKLPKHIKSAKLCQLSWDISLAHWTKNYYKCLMMMPKLPHLLCAIVSIHMQSIRRELLQSFSMGYQSKVLTVPLEWLSEVLLIDSMEHLEQDCKYYGITVDRKTKTAKFAKADFNAVIPVAKSRREPIVECLLNGSIENILLFK